MNTMRANWAEVRKNLREVQMQSALTFSDTDEDRRFAAEIERDVATDSLVLVLIFMQETGQLEEISEYLEVVYGRVS